jgi:hypothetical protein
VKGNGLSMEKLKDILWPIVLVGGLGAFIDFLIGKAGQERAKDFLLRWWVRFDDVRWRNFGREEGLFAGRVIERWFGRRIWSVRRFTSASILIVILFLIHSAVAYIGFITAPLEYPCFRCRFSFDMVLLGYIFVGLLASLIGFSASVSFTKFISFRMAELCGDGGKKNLTVFFLMLAPNYVMLVIWLQIIKEKEIRSIVIVLLNVGELDLLLYAEFWVRVFPILVTDMIKYATEPLKERFYFVSSALVSPSEYNIYSLATDNLSALPSLCRFMVSVVFVGSFLLRPVVMRPTSLVWARIVESDKPVFTVIFGGAGALASALSEVAKHL